MKHFNRMRRRQQAAVKEERLRLNDRNLGPKSLRERVTALGGTLAVRSSQGGALLEITIPPIAKPGARDAD